MAVMQIMIFVGVKSITHNNIYLGLLLLLSGIYLPLIIHGIRCSEIDYKKDQLGLPGDFQVVGKHPLNDSRFFV